MSNFVILDRPPAGWFVLDVLRWQARERDWVALVIDVHPDELDRGRRARHALVRIPGKHRNRDAASDALQDLVATRH
jgi:hypothetical protein